MGIRNTITAIALFFRHSLRAPPSHSKKPNPSSRRLLLHMVSRHILRSTWLHADHGIEKRKTSPKDVTEAIFNSYISAANQAISSFDLEIRSTEHQTSRVRTYALINSTDDPITQLATSHSADEISYVKRVLDAMFETYNTARKEIMAITSKQAMRLNKAPVASPGERQNGSNTPGSANQGLTMVQAEKLLKALVEEGWFELSEKSFYSLSPRALMELRGWLIDTYNDDDDDEPERVMRIKFCFACKEIITMVSVDPAGKALCADVMSGPAMSE